jgi:ubiquinone/menaquinone biosynthesis C-methylase UbiE
MTGGQSFDDTASRKLEAVYQTPDVIAQRHRTLTALELREGEHVLDIGAGPGLLVADMAAVVGPTGHVTGLEINGSMLAVARRRRASSAIGDRITLVKADAEALPFPDASFDVATSTQVYEYVADVDQALAELHRVLRPGGRALILDTDWASIVWNTTDRARMDRVVAAWIDRFADPHLPRSLSRRLRDAGFHIRQRQTLVLLNPEYDPDTYSVTNASIMADFVIGRHDLTSDEVQAWQQDLAQLGAEGRYFFSLNRYLFLVDKPATTSRGSSAVLAADSRGLTANL